MNRRELFDKVWEIQQEIIATQELLALLKQEQFEEKQQAEREKRAAERQRRAALALARDPALPIDGTARSDDMIRKWRSGETYDMIADRYGLSRERIRQIIAKREREERRALDAKLNATTIPGRILYGQEYEFTAEDPETPIVRVPRGAQTVSSGWAIRYKKAQATSASTSKAGAGS